MTLSKRSISTTAVIMITLAVRGFGNRTDCHGFPVEGEGKASFSTDLSENIRRQMEHAVRNGLDTTSWLDTARFGFLAYFRRIEPDSLAIDSSKPGITPAFFRDTLSSKAYRAWGRTMLTDFEIYDFSEPSIRMDPSRANGDRVIAGLRATRKTLLLIREACYVLALEPFAESDLSIRPDRKSFPGDLNPELRRSFNLLGQTIEWGFLYQNR